MTSFIFDHALLPSGWARGVRIEVGDGVIVRVDASAPGGGQHVAGQQVAGIALPGLPNLHSHAFQKGMAGLSERRGPASDNFWTWREVMYRFLGALTPDDVEAIAAYAYMEMLEAGFTAVGEFHYLHHDTDGAPYADLGEMTTRIVAAAAQTGISLTLLPCFYAYGGFGGAPATHGQRRFINQPERFLQVVERTREIAKSLPGTRVGIAPHSLRAVTPETLKIVLEEARGGPVHIHAAEQTKEVDDCIASLGQRPVQWLLDHAAVDDNWCFIHATHMTPEETVALAASGAVAGLCPLTEANLGDGIFSGQEYLACDGRFGIGTDSNIQIDAAAELRQLEYAQRLKRRERNVLARTEGDSLGAQLYAGALRGGAQALGLAAGALKVGQRADIVVLDDAHPDLTGRAGDAWLDSYVFVTGRRAVKTVIAAGELVVADGRHRQHDAIARRYREVLGRLAVL